MRPIVFVLCLSVVLAPQVAKCQSGTLVNFTELHVVPAGLDVLKFERSKYIVLNSEQGERQFLRSVPEENYLSSNLPLNLDFNVSYSDSVVIGIVRPSAAANNYLEIDSIVHRGSWLEVYATETQSWYSLDTYVRLTAFVRIPRLGLPVEFKAVRVRKLEPPE